MKNLCIIFLILAICITLCACASTSNTTDEEDNKISSSADAIAATKNDDNTEIKIRKDLGFKFCEKLEYGTCKATKLGGGNWEVTLHGNMCGYYDDEKLDIDLVGFVHIAKISENGEILSSSTKKTTDS